MKTDCRETRALMSGAVDNELYRSESQTFHEHIEICGSCRDEYELERLTKAYLKKKITFVDVPYDVEQAIMAQFSVQAQPEEGHESAQGLLRNRIFQPVLAVGSVFVIGILLLFANKSNVILPVFQKLPEAVEIAQQDALLLAETDFQDILSGKFKPKITAGTMQEVASYVDQNAGFPVQLPSVANADWIGGTVSDFAGNKMAQVVYKMGEDYIYICSFPEKAVSLNKVSLPPNCAKVIENCEWFWGQDSNGDTQAAWSHDDHVWIATSNLEKNDLVAYLKPPKNNDGEKQ